MHVVGTCFLLRYSLGFDTCSGYLFLAWRLSFACKKFLSFQTKQIGLFCSSKTESFLFLYFKIFLHFCLDLQLEVHICNRCLLFDVGFLVACVRYIWFSNKTTQTLVSLKPRASPCFMQQIFLLFTWNLSLSL